MEKARGELVAMLIKYRSVKKHDITLVFDGYRNGAGKENVSVTGGVKVIYSRLGERADDVIKRIVSAERREWTVVTSDRDIANHAWASGSIPVPSERFFEIVSGAVKPEGTEYANNEEGFDDMPFKDDSGVPGHQKGRSHMPSRKEKAVSKALSRL